MDGHHLLDDLLSDCVADEIIQFKENLVGYIRTEGKMNLEEYLDNQTDILISGIKTSIKAVTANISLTSERNVDLQKAKDLLELFKLINEIEKHCQNKK